MSNNGFSLYGSQAASIASSYGLNPAIFSGLIETESSWNPFASPGTTSAFGLTQLTRGTAAQMGVNPHDPIQNLKGGAAYLSGLLKQFGGDYGKALAAYHDGPGAIGQHGGYAYAQTVMKKAQGYLADGARALGFGIVADAVDPNATATNPTQDACGLNPICYLQQWITNSGFFKRLSLAMVAFILLAAAFYLMNSDKINDAVKTAAMA